MSKARIVGLCGTHGTGKSTIINGIRDLGYKVNQAQLSRSAQKALGWDTLSRAQESKANMWALQYAIMDAMFDRDQEALSTGEIVLVERTPADIWAYTEMWCRRLNIDPINDQQAREYKAQCRSFADNYCRFLFIPVSEAVKFVAEPNRADLESRTFVDIAIRKFIESGDLPLTEIKSSGVVTRIAEAQTAISIQRMKL
jgi:predicted ATPase